jgi:hypothetical protein
MKQVEMIAGVNYERITDAKRAIEQGTRLALAL